MGCCPSVFRALSGCSPHSWPWTTLCVLVMEFIIKSVCSISLIMKETSLALSVYIKCSRPHRSWNGDLLALSVRTYDVPNLVVAGQG
jgi:hypothetical protein